MGREQGRRRIHLLLYITCIFSAAQLTVGCAGLINRLEINSSLTKSRQMVDQGDFQTALLENEKALAQPLQISRDRALLQRGLIYSHPQNPSPDYSMSELYFQGVVDQYPDGILSDIAERLILYLRQISAEEEKNRILQDKIDRMERSLKEQRKADYQHQEKLKSLRTDVEKLSSKNDQMKNVLKKQQGKLDYYRNQLRIRKKKIDLLNSQKESIDLLNSQVENLTIQIEKMKKIDLNIEKKKKNIKIQ